MQCNIYLQIFRPDLAAKTVSKMRELEDDDPLTTLATIALCLYHGGQEKVNECLEMLDDLCQSSASGETILMKNMQAVANIHLQNYTQAWKLCKQARDIASKANMETDENTLVNSIVCLQHLTKGQKILPKLHSELKRISPEHPFVRQTADMSQMFDRAAANFSI